MSDNENEEKLLIPAFFDATLYRILKEKIIDGMYFYIGDRNSANAEFYIGDRNSACESKCIWCGEWENDMNGYGQYKVDHRADCPAERLIQMCDEALAILS